MFRLDVDARRAVQAIEPADEQGRARHADQPDERRGDGVRPIGRPQLESSAVGAGALADQVAAGMVYLAHAMNEAKLLGI
jgi:hypothetical protein